MSNDITLTTHTGSSSWPVRIEPEVLSLLAEVSRFLRDRQVDSFLVGGFVRDTLLGRPTGDIDIAVAADVLQIAPEMAEALRGRAVSLDEVNRIIRVVLLPEPDQKTSKKQWYIDLSTLARDIHQDLSRRDFTINAMAIDLHSLVTGTVTPQLLDPFGGVDDLHRKVIRAVNDRVFEEDPARLLRAQRLASELGFSISPETAELISRNSRLITRVAGERIREELVRILAAPEAGLAVRCLDNLGLLTAIIPELEPGRGFEQPVEHHWDVLDHALETVSAIGFLLRQGSWKYGTQKILEDVPWSDTLQQHFATPVGSGTTHAVLVKLAALLHDIAKPATRIIANEKIRFFGHPDQGAETVVKILERLRFSNKETRLVETMVRCHLRPTQLSHEGLPSPRAIYRYRRDTGNAAIDTLFLSLADHLAARGPDLDPEQWKWHVGQTGCVLTECTRREVEAPPPRLIDGHDLINIFGLKPGPGLREILEAVREAQEAGEITTREQALYYVKNRLLYSKQK